MSKPNSPSPFSLFTTILNYSMAIMLSLGIGGSALAFGYAAIKTMRDRKLTADAPPPAKASQSVPEAPAPASAPPPPTPSNVIAGGADTASLDRGKVVYMQVCFACHQPTGLGLPGMFPPLAGSDWAATKKPDRMIRMVLHGVTGPININGKPFTTPAPMMPPQGAALSDTQIADVLTYVRSEYGNKASAVTPDMVKAVRDSEKARTAMWTEAELQKIPAE